MGKEAANSHLHAWSGHVRQLDSPTETLVLLWVIVLQADLKLNGFGKLTLLGL